jgi:3-deoxy-D-manno-octulosonate 8-phosphate phosphatase (KDO 8-P phosphatase)
MQQKAEQLDIRCLCLDVDGVLTDGSIHVTDAGEQARVFHVHDGIAIHWFREFGGEVMICSGKTSEAVAARMHELGVRHVIQGSRDKLRDVQDELVRLGVAINQLAMIGDDLPDVPLMRACGYAIAVANAADEVKHAARFVTQQRGGSGAVREAVEHLLRASGRWTDVLGAYGLAGDGRADP